MSIQEWSWMDDKKTETKTNKVNKILSMILLIYFIVKI